MPYAQSDPQADFRITYHGTITTITPLSDACREWLEDNVAIEPWQRFGIAVIGDAEVGLGIGLLSVRHKKTLLREEG